MKIGCNLSNELMELIDEDKVTVDYVKIALSKSDDEIPVKYKDYGKLLLHGVGTDIPQHTGAAELSNVNWNQVKGSVEFCNSKFIGLHCATYRSDWDEQEITYEMVKERMGSTLQLWKENLDIELLIENVPYTPYYETNSPGIIRYSVYPELIKQLCSEYEIGLLLDIAHAKVTASGLGLSVEDYMSALPLERVKEIHVVGTRDTKDGLRDHHLEMNEDDYKNLEFILKITNPELVTLEYGGFGEHFLWRSDKKAIERQLKKIVQIVNNKR
ncbi:multinuclear nonheme iron-dependent oxidase [Anaerocolumna sp. MB42-C2]|uniref:multinuclear nonheme iron-dependent oxidase n=1 Tax=Anaerocolumna sp. MB42-C2 TaxID=3070997 RepID=UPI0027E0791B|nr:DUF692 family multinuclear iron-containing protein [Anaerocolumna sp. MB42-C2]WMJ86312.1 DUF692 family protein [Anaerocolumna sp. MB42-C2]